MSTERNIQSDPAPRVGQIWEYIPDYESKSSLDNLFIIVRCNSNSMVLCCLYSGNRWSRTANELGSLDQRNRIFGADRNSFQYRGFSKDIFNLTNAPTPDNH